MLVRAKTLCFIGNVRRRPGSVFEWKGSLGSCLEPAEDVQTKPVETKSDNNPMGDDEIRVRLAEYGVRTHPATKREKLLEKLAEVEGKQ